MHGKGSSYRSAGLCQSIACCGASLPRSNGSGGSVGRRALLSRQHCVGVQDVPQGGAVLVRAQEELQGRHG